MLKKSFSTVGCMGLTYDQIISLCKKHCMEGIEIRMDNDDTCCGCKSEEELRELKQAMSESKIKITNLGSSVCFMGYEKEKLQNVFPFHPTYTSVPVQGRRTMNPRQSFCNQFLCLLHRFQKARPDAVPYKVFQVYIVIH